MAQLLHTPLPFSRAYRGNVLPLCSTLGAAVRCRSTALTLPSTQQGLRSLIASHSNRCGRIIVRAYEQGSSGPSRDPSLDGFVELKVSVVRTVAVLLAFVPVQ